MGTDTLNNDSCPTRIVGADRIRPLAKRIGIGWLNGICSGFYHPSGKTDGFGGRRPSSGNIVGSEEPPILPASPRGKPRGANQSRLPFIQLLAKIRGYGRMISAPTGCSGNHWLATTNRVHSLSQPVRADSSLREGAKAALPQREAKPPLL